MPGCYPGVVERRVCVYTEGGGSNPSSPSRTRGPVRRAAGHKPEGRRCESCLVHTMRP